METRIKELREQKKMSQMNLAVKIGCSQNTISKIEKGEADPRGSLLVELSELFGVSVDYMLGISEEKLTTDRKARLTRLIDTSQEYMENYAKLSDESKQAVNTVVDRMLKIEEESC